MPTLDEYRKKASELEKQNNLPEGILWKISGIESSPLEHAIEPVTNSVQSVKVCVQLMPAAA